MVPLRHALMLLTDDATIDAIFRSKIRLLMTQNFSLILVWGFFTEMHVELAGFVENIES